MWLHVFMAKAHILCFRRPNCIASLLSWKLLFIFYFSAHAKDILSTSQFLPILFFFYCFFSQRIVHAIVASTVYFAVYFPDFSMQSDFAWYQQIIFSSILLQYKQQRPVSCFSNLYNFYYYYYSSFMHTLNTIRDHKNLYYFGRTFFHKKIEQSYTVQIQRIFNY